MSETEHQSTMKDKLLDALKTYFGHKSFRGTQESIVRNVLAKQDTFVIMPTGAGKSICYQLPAILMEGMAVVISPLIALMKNQVDQLNGNGIESHFLNSSLSKKEATEIRERVLQQQVKLLYVAPETLVKQEFIDFLRQIPIAFVAVDEAHCISEWGHDFRPEYRKIKSVVTSLGSDIPIIALTATATPKVQADIQKNLHMMDAKVFKSSFNRHNLYYEVRSKLDAVKEVIKYAKQNKGKSGIIYCLSRKKVEEIAEVLNVNGIKALPYHAGLDASTRERNQDRFLNSDVDVVVATIAFGMGIDKPDVRYVIHYDVPKSLEGYYQETGRAGRDGLQGNCIMFYNYQDIVKLEKFMKDKSLSERETSKQLLMEMAAYCESSICRRKFLLHYFGEDYAEAECIKSGKCDNCTHPKSTFEAKEYAVLFLKAVIETKEKCTSSHLIHVLTGAEVKAIKDFGHDKLEIYKKGADLTTKDWEALVRHLLVYDFVKKDIDTYGFIRMQENGHNFLRAPYNLSVSKDRDYHHEKAESLELEDFKTYDEVLFDKLMKLRKQVSVQKKLPPFVIFQEPSLEDMATRMPTTEEEFLNIVGVGKGKYLKFGKPFLELIRTHVKENEIEKDEEIIVRTNPGANKTSNKLFIIQQIDRKIPLENIAKLKSLTFEEVLEDLEQIVNSGTKLNLDYYIREKVEEDKMTEIMDYFMKAQDDTLESATKELADDIEEWEIKLVKMKFLSEVGN